MSAQHTYETRVRPEWIDHNGHMNVDYCSELFVDDSIRVETDLVDVDAKRIHYLHRMYNAKTDQLAARNECLCMNVDLEGRESTPFPESVLELLMSARHTGPTPEGFGRKLGIRHDSNN